MSTIGKVLVSLLLCGILGGELWAIVWRVDDWPFASNPMFGFYVSQGSPLYDLVWVVEGGTGRADRDLDARSDLHMIGLSDFKRLFFSKYYGSSDPRFPQAHHEGDTPAAFSSRLTSYCRSVERILVSHGAPASGLRLELRRIDRAEPVRVIGRYDAGTREFSLASERGGRT